MSDVENYSYPDIEPIDYIDESLDKIKARDDAAKHGFRRVTTLPVVSADDIGMEVYLIGNGVYKLTAFDAEEPTWKKIVDVTRNPAYTDWVLENFQDRNDILTSLSLLDPNADSLVYFNSAGIALLSPITQFILGVLSSTNAAEFRNALSLGDLSTLDSPLNGSYIEDGTISLAKVTQEFRTNLGFSTGDVKLTYKTTADSGWVIANDGSIGNTGSGATTRANADTEALFKLMWNIPACTLQTYTGAASTKTTAAADWSANKRLILPKVLGRAMGVAGSGESLTTRSLGSTVGAESFELTTSNMPAHNHNLCTANFGFGQGTYVVGNIRATANKNADFTGYMSIQPQWRDDESLYTQGTEGSGSPVDNMQPTSFLNLMIKL